MLPKWPALTVEGSKVTAEQAAQILIRTNLWQGCNDAAWEKQVWEAVEIQTAHRHHVLGWKEREKLNRELGLLNLSYLHNHRIMTCWVGGPHGWCDWNGTIRSTNYNIGKWPTVEEVRDDWAVIAKAFPFLTLRAQLWSHEVSDPEARPVVEYKVKDGAVEVIKTPLTAVLSPTDAFDYRLYDRGCSNETLKWAVGLVRQNQG